MEKVVKVITNDQHVLHGLITSPSEETKKILINIHGTASNFYIEDFLPIIAKELLNNGIATLATNNRGANALKGWERGGASEEIFEECLLDINAWIRFASEQGYEEIYLQGHSLGAEKVVYYMAKGEFRDKITKVILLAPADSYGTEMNYIQKIDKDLLDEAEMLVAQGKGQQFLTSEWFCHAGVLPKSAESFVDFFLPGSELSQALPLRHGTELKLYKEIKVPILVAISDNEEYEYTVIPINDALNLMKKENSLTEATQIPDCDHIFSTKEKELATTVRDFLAA